MHTLPSLSAYLSRIGYPGPLEPTAEVLRAIHRQHLLTISYENLDIHLGHTLSLDLSTIFDKIVRRRRGGWCYEMNGLLAWALRAIGFDVTLLAGSVGRERMGDLAEGNHLVLLVHLDQPWIADAGFGNGILEPLPMVEGEHVQEGFVFRLEREARVGGTTGERWFFHNHQHGGVGFDFTLKPHAMDDFAERCTWLQTSPDSSFVRVLVYHRWRHDGIHSLRGATLQHATPQGVTERTLDSADDYRQVLHDTFALELGDEVRTVWPKVWQSHLAWLATQHTPQT